ncbi:hypothetical protein L9G74_18175 [Shewanella sp. C32]|uniref:DUF4145 domain-containing protein n=1 Tax=Shewanella electrica TaxID=515560 RepID=A0ABT2FQ66_9GAMM|nr:hypothetical protein [Shewanella electrica]MCH1926807.1 hypothetical protein [Shewanella electrica]MCS4558368.1 hypothetical protein [Shewanella electrica]
MSYKVIRRDLTEVSRRCDFCPNYLRSLKAYVLEDSDSGELFYAGPTCAKHKAGDDALTGIPDFTKFTKEVGEREGGGAGGGAGGSGTENSEKKAIEYIVLRESKLADELNCSYKVLRDYYEKHKAEGLSESDVKHINNIASKAPEHLTLTALQRIYNYLFWIDVGIERLPEEKTDFLVGVRKTIISKGKITDNQKSAINKWLENIAGVPQLK